MTDETTTETTELEVVPTGPLPEEVLVGHFVRIVSGEFADRYAVLLEKVGDKDALVRTRDIYNRTVVVPLDALQATSYKGGR